MTWVIPLCGSSGDRAAVPTPYIQPWRSLARLIASFLVHAIFIDVWKSPSPLLAQGTSIDSRHDWLTPSVTFFVQGPMTAASATAAEGITA